MDNPKKNKADGTADDMKGRAKEAAGAVTNDSSTRTEGRKDQLKGKAKKKIGEVKEKMRK